MPKKILVVDDDRDLVEMLCLQLQGAGYATVRAGTGLEAIQQACSAAPDLILLDLALPEGDGFAVCETLRRHPLTASVPILMLTGLPGELPRFAGVEAGADDYLRKPFDSQDLLARVEFWLKRRASAPRAAEGT